MDLIATASAAYYAIERLRWRRRVADCKCKPAFERLCEADGWRDDHDDVYGSQIED